VADHPLLNKKAPLVLMVYDGSLLGISAEIPAIIDEQNNNHLMRQHGDI